MALTHQGGSFSISPTPIPEGNIPLNEAAFDAITDFLRCPGMINAPSFRVEQNILTQNTLDSDIGQKQGGFRQAEDTEASFAFLESDPGINALNAAARTQNIYAVKYELNNSRGTNGTTYFALAIVSGGGGPVGGEGEDFANLVFGLAMTHQFPVQKAAA